MMSTLCTVSYGVQWYRRITADYTVILIKVFTWTKIALKTSCMYMYNVLLLCHLHGLKAQWHVQLLVTCTCWYLDFKRCIEGHLEVLSMRIFGKGFLPRLLEEWCVERVAEDHVTTVSGRRLEWGNAKGDSLTTVSGQRLEWGVMQRGIP